jgi:hypothetical protein
MNEIKKSWMKFRNTIDWRHACRCHRWGELERGHCTRHKHTREIFISKWTFCNRKYLLKRNTSRKERRDCLMTVYTFVYEFCFSLLIPNNFFLLLPPSVSSFMPPRPTYIKRVGKEEVSREYGCAASSMSVFVRMWMCNDRKKNVVAWLKLHRWTHTPLIYIFVCKIGAIQTVKCLVTVSTRCAHI